MRGIKERMNKRKSKKRMKKIIKKSEKELVETYLDSVSRVGTVKLPKRRVRDGLSFPKKSTNLSLKRTAAYTSKEIPVQFIAQGLPSAQKARFFLNRQPIQDKNILDWEKGRTLFQMKRKKPRWLARNSEKVVDSMAEALFEHTVQRGIHHGDLQNADNIVIQKKGLRKVKVKFIDYSKGEWGPSYEMNREKLKELDKRTENLWNQGISPNKYSYSHKLAFDIRKDYVNLLNLIYEFPVSKKKKQELAKRFKEKFEKLAEERL